LPRLQHARRVAESGKPGRHVTGDHATGADHSSLTDADARQDNRATANPDIATDADGATEFQTCADPESSGVLIKLTTATGSCLHVYATGKEGIPITFLPGNWNMLEQ
jgi:hypothetical protein